jgi:hypothetical protein
VRTGAAEGVRVVGVEKDAHDVPASEAVDRLADLLGPTLDVDGLKKDLWGGGSEMLREASRGRGRGWW